MNFPHLATRLFNTPLAITPHKAELIIAALAERLGVTRLVRHDGTMLAFDDYNDFGGVDRDCDDPIQRKGYDIVDGIAVIPIIGTLVHRLGTLRPYSGMTGYDGIQQNFLLALEDPSVKAIVFDVDSPGGEVAGCADLADVIYRARGQKPVWAILGESAWSAAYWLASACDRVTVPRTGGTGSIGVICMHVDFSKALSQGGITVTLLHYGARKADGADVAPLSKEARDRFMADITASGELFVATVARNRRLSADAVRAQQATTFQGKNGVVAGLADAVMAPHEAFGALLGLVRSLERQSTSGPAARSIAGRGATTKGAANGR